MYAVINAAKKTVGFDALLSFKLIIEQCLDGVVACDTILYKV